MGTVWIRVSWADWVSSRRTVDRNIKKIIPENMKKE